MSWEQRNHDFSTAQVDAQVAYIEAEREVKRLEEENAKLRKMVRECHELLQDLLSGWTLQPLTVEIMEQRMRELGVDDGTEQGVC